MKAVSIKEPWASMILEGKKTIETRKWSTKYRGDILLCASKSPKSNISGKAFAIANLVDVRPMIREDEKKACCGVYKGAFSWFLNGVKKIKLFDVRGQLGLFDVNYEGDMGMKQYIAQKDLEYLANKGAYVPDMTFNVVTKTADKLKSGKTIPVGVKGVPIGFTTGGRILVFKLEGFGNIAYKTDNMYKKLSGVTKPPTLNMMEKWEERGSAKSITGKTVEPDGYGSDGSPSWLLVLGLI